MMYNASTTIFEDYMKNNTKNKDYFKQKDFWLIHYTFALYSSIQDIIDIIENEKDSYAITGRNDYYKFIQDYYSKYNKLKSLMTEVIKGNEIAKNEREELEEMLNWGNKFIESVFHDNYKKVHISQCTLAGYFYNTFFYYWKSVEKMLFDKYNSDKSKEVEQIFAALKNDLNEINSLQDKVKNKRKFNNKEKEWAAAMWSRTLDFIEDKFNEARLIIENKREFDPIDF